MTITEAIFLGIVEGVTEFLPVSSTGHLIVASRLLGIETTEFLKTFQIVIQAGAILAVLPLFVRRAIKSPKKIGHIFAAFIPTAVVGVIVYPFVKDFFNYPSLVAWSLLIGGVVIIAIEYRVKHRQEQDPEFVMKKSISLKQAVILGIYQTIAFIPGVSRSGSTIVGGLLQGIDRRAIVEFSFLLSVPTIIAASGYDLLQTQAFFSGTNIMLLVVGFISSWISAMVCISVFLRFVATHTFIAFGWYRIIAGIILLLFFF